MEEWNTNLSPAEFGITVVNINDNVPQLQMAFSTICEIIPWEGGIIRFAEVRNEMVSMKQLQFA